MSFLSIAVLSIVLSCININTAPKQELEKIKHIGPSRADQIINFRQKNLFSSLEDLEVLKGIGPARIADIEKQGLACLRDEISSKEPLKPANNLAQIKINKTFLNQSLLFSAALIIAIFSGFAILLLKKLQK